MRSGSMRRAVVLVAMCLAASALPGRALAEGFPIKPVRIVVPASPGGALDLTTRLVAQKMSEKLGQTVIVDNRPGGDNLLGIRMAKNAPADGYTITAQANGFTLLPNVKSEAGFDPVTDFTAIGVMIRSPLVMSVGADQPDRTLADFVARARANPGKLSYGSAGMGTPTHIAAALFLQIAGLQATHVPYRGNGPALPDVASGRVDTIFDGYISSIPYLTSGKFRPIAVTSSTRIAPLPNAPTFREQGYDYDYELWLGLFAPAGTPKDAVDRLSEALRYATSSKELSERFRSEGSDPSFLTPAEFQKFINNQVVEMAKLAKDLDLPKQ